VKAPRSWPKSSDFEVGRVAARAELVNQARKLVFTRTAFAGDEHGGGGVGDFAG
jgi:hypothetical protein